MSTVLIRVNLPMPNTRGFSRRNVPNPSNSEKLEMVSNDPIALKALADIGANVDFTQVRDSVKASLALQYAKLTRHVADTEASVDAWASNPKTERRITRDRLLEKLEYQEDTGEFIWKATTCRGQIAGHVAKERGKSYRRIRIDDELIMAHALVWLVVHGEFPHHEIDHIDGNGLNNRVSNLAKSNRLKNNSNTRQRSDSAEHRSVYPNGNFWYTIVKYAKKEFSVTGFDTPDLAAKARNFLETLIPRGSSHGQDKLYPPS